MSQQDKANPYLVYNREEPWEEWRMAHLVRYHLWLGQDEAAKALEGLRWHWAGGYCYAPPVILGGREPPPQTQLTQWTKYAIMILPEAHWCAVEVEQLEEQWSVTTLGATLAQQEHIGRMLEKALPTDHPPPTYAHEHFVRQPHCCGWQILQRWYDHIACDMGPIPFIHHHLNQVPGYYGLLARRADAAMTHALEQADIEENLRRFIQNMRHRYIIHLQRVSRPEPIAVGEGVPFTYTPEDDPWHPTSNEGDDTTEEELIPATTRPAMHVLQTELGRYLPPRQQEQLNAALRDLQPEPTPRRPNRLPRPQSASASSSTQPPTAAQPEGEPRPPLPQPINPSTTDAITYQACGQNQPMPVIYTDLEQPNTRVERLSHMALFGLWMGSDEMDLALERLREEAPQYHIPPALIWAGNSFVQAPEPTTKERICYTIHIQAHWIGVYAHHDHHQWRMGFIGATRAQANQVYPLLRQHMAWPDQTSANYNQPMVPIPHICGWQLLQHWHHVTGTHQTPSGRYKRVVAHQPMAEALTHVQHTTEDLLQQHVQDPLLQDLIRGVRQRTTLATLDEPPKAAVYYGGTKGDVDRQRLRDLLNQHGVPASALAQRVAETIQIPQAELRKALSGKNPWAALKRVAQEANHRLVRKEELQQHIAQQQKQGPGPNVKSQGRPTPLPKAGDLQLLPGWFVQADGGEAPQHPHHNIDAGTTGVSVIDAEALEPWLARQGKHPQPLLLQAPTTRQHPYQRSKSQPCSHPHRKGSW